MEEIWKEIKGYEEKYLVSNLGRVKSLERKDRMGRKVKERIIIPRVHSSGYLRVGLCRKDFYIHRLVAETFINNPENKQYVNHKDGDKTNNNVCNLEWSTPSENMLHAYYVLKYSNSEIMRSHATCMNKIIKEKERRRFSEEQIKEIRKLSGVMTEKEIAKRFGCSRSTIGEIKNRKIYKDVQ